MAPGAITAPITVCPLPSVAAIVRVDVVVRTKKVGHFFPGGTVDAFDTWLELKGLDDKGQTIYWSGERGRQRARAGGDKERTSIVPCRSMGTATPSTSATPGQLAPSCMST